MGSPSELLKTALAARHRQSGARMVDFAGWDMPVQYPTGILAEHAAVRTRCGMFDLSHMGRVYVRGADTLALAQECCTRDLARIPSGEAAYGLLCSEDGGIVDDVIAYKLGPAEVMFVFNASNRLVDSDFFIAERDRLGLDAQVVDRTLETALVGVQGPSAQAVLQSRTEVDLEAMAGYAFTNGQVCGVRALISRTGYTGEDGFEVMVDAEQAERVWTELTEAAVPCGLGARDTLRTEAGFALYGHEIDHSTNPFEARLGWVVNFAKASFVGREALSNLKAEGPHRRLVGLRVAPGGVPRPGLPILDDTSRAVGQVTSGTFSPTLKANIAMGYAPVELSQPGQALNVELRGKPAAAEVVALPFVPHRSRPRAKM
jgi:glycine cleavage system T protein (aminomethyltransferase)